MSKYGFEIDMSDKSSTGIILGEIKSGSVVLEFGCAFGRMTRYMKEELSCKVYIVEYDAEAFDTAIKYAEDGLCDDIRSLGWVERFGNIAFDAIIFADVLEHLQCPELIVENAAALLKDTGKIHISIPNITHNDVLLKAYNERFDYTSVGILDDTHVHFWGLKNIDGIVGNSGLSVSKVTATYCETGHTEQFGRQGKEGNVLLENLLRERQCGEVYQFIITLDKNQNEDTVYSLKAPTLKCLVYIDDGNDFLADNCTGVYAARSADGSYHVHYEIKDTAKIKRVRLDPVEHQNCIVKNISFRQGENELDLIRAADAELENGCIFLGDDPMIYAEVEENGAEIIIDADIFLWSESYLQILQTEYIRRYAGAADASKRIAELTKSEKECRERIIELQTEISRQELERGALNSLAYKKDAYVLRLKQRIAGLEGDVAYYRNLKIVKLREFIIRAAKWAAKKVLKCIKAIAGKVAGKGEKR